MKCEILGPLKVAHGQVKISAAKHRALFAALLCDHGQVVTLDQLVDEIWQEDPPRTAANLLRQYIYQLRKSINLGKTSSVDRVELITYSSGYSLQLGEDDLDRDNFDSLLSAGQRALANAELAKAIQLLTDALLLWRGPALTDVPATPKIVAEVRRLEGRKALAEELRIEAKLIAGQHAEIVDELAGLMLARPTNERLREHLMRTLYALGRRAEALEVYREGRRALIDGLGIEPGPALQSLERQVLNDELSAVPAPRTTAVLSPRTAGGSDIPRQLPNDLSDFTGRSEDVALISRALTVLDTPCQVMEGLPVVAVSGRPGVGKSALALRVAHQVQAYFPDGQLYAALGRGRLGSTPGNILYRFLRALGIADSRIPAAVEERAEIFRSVVADRRVLVVIDNAVNEADVRILLPGSSSSAALVTCRQVLGGIEGAAHFTCAPLDFETALAMLRKVAGRQRIDQELNDARKLVRRCCGLPLVLRILGVKLSTRPHLTVGQLAHQLSGENQLDELRLGELDLRARILDSYHSLYPRERVILRCLVTMAGHRFTASDLEDILGETSSVVSASLDLLVDHHFLEVVNSVDGGEVSFRIDYFHRLVVQDLLVQLGSKSFMPIPRESSKECLVIP